MFTYYNVFHIRIMITKRMEKNKRNKKVNMIQKC